ncbi:MAG: glycosyltransferase, partial [Anaerolineae bacterium]|nr:glycosyltransferase [Anaerolineae bacterium]
FAKLEVEYRQLEEIIEELEYKTVCFQAKLTYENLNDNWVISLFKADYASWFNYLLPGLHKNRMAIPLGGTSNHFKVDFLRYVGGWDAYNVAEDCDLGMWIARHDKQVRVLNSITWEVASPNIVSWVKQRSRWIKGYAQSYFVHMRRPLMLLRDLGWRRFWGFQFTVGSGFLMPMLSPFFYVMTGIYLISLTAIIITGFTTSETTLEFAKIPLRYIYDIHYYWILPFGTGSFFIANIIYFLILVIGQLRHPKPGNMRWVVTWWWLYWLFMNAAAFRALWEYIFDPYSWELSDHSYL